MAQQTAVEFLQEKYNSRQVYEESIFDEEFEQAKAMEKEHIAKAWDAGKHQYFSFGIPEIEFNNGEEYYDINYNETYNK
jgi:hypothetical protein